MSESLTSAELFVISMKASSFCMESCSSQDVSMSDAKEYNQACTPSAKAWSLTRMIWHLLRHPRLTYTTKRRKNKIKEVWWGTLDKRTTTLEMMSTDMLQLTYRCECQLTIVNRHMSLNNCQRTRVVWHSEQNPNLYQLTFLRRHIVYLTHLVPLA